MKSPAPGRILIVDDERLNRELFEAYFAQTPHEVVVAASGAEALERAKESPPDIVLLDVMMPGIDGFTTAQQLKAMAGDDFLPIILVTALGDHASRMKGFEAGADEFLQKPVNRLELYARVRNLLALRHEQRALAERNAQLVALQRLRDELSSLVIHDLKSPLAAVTMNLRYLAEQLGTRPDTPDDLREALSDARMASQRVMRMIADLLDVSRAEESRLVARRTRVSLGQLIDEAVREQLALARDRRVRLAVEIPPGATAFADPGLLQRMLENMLDNAVRYTPAGGRVLVRAASNEHGLHLDICNDGQPIPAGLRRELFDKWAQVAGTARNGPNRGLGLYFCRLAAEAHGGTIEAAEGADYPVCFRLRIPGDAEALRTSAM